MTRLARLTEFETALLRALSDHSGCPRAYIAQRVNIFRPGGVTPRQWSANVGYELLRMEAHGYARRMDDGKPIIWLRTPLGRAALGEPS